jgi:CheY-like chemotaxis protein
VRISVTDSGDGIAPEFLPLIFDRFSQADSSSRRTHGGIGVGLSIVKSLVEAHGGTVKADSAGLGKGTVFTVVLPVCAVPSNDVEREQLRPATTTVVEPAKDEWPMLTGISILVVDDEKDARELVQLMLEERGAKVRTAASAAEARDLLGISRPDVIVCDIGMPNEDGYDFIASLKSQGKGIPAIALTAFARHEDRSRSLQAGYRSHLTKPVEPIELLKAIVALV